MFAVSGHSSGFGFSMNNMEIFFYLLGGFVKNFAEQWQEYQKTSINATRLHLD
jgi:hypothetical protein